MSDTPVIMQSMEAIVQVFTVCIAAQGRAEKKEECCLRNSVRSFEFG